MSSALSTDAPAGVLYISYDGMLEPLGQSQVLSYLERLAAGRPIHLISFEKPEDWAHAEERARVARRIAAAGIRWSPLRYHKRPSALATAYDILQGACLGVRLARRHGLGVVHARSYVPSVMALAIRKLTGARYVFDMRGLWADERVDAGLWPANGRLYRLAKWFERRFLLTADAVVSLTRAAALEIASFPYLAGRTPPITVIPTCADLERFRPAARPGGGFTLGYVGTVGNWYDFEKTARLFGHLRAARPDARLLVLNRGEHELIRATLTAAGIPDGVVTIRAVEHAEAPALIQTMDAGVLIARPAYSHIARAPTKLAEFLGCGAPCLVNAGVGDMEATIGEQRVGVVMQGFTDADCAAAVRALLALTNEPDIASRCVDTARRHFSLQAGVDAYAGLYETLSGAGAGTGKAP